MNFMKRTLTDQEKRTVRVAAVGIAVYLVLFFGFKIWKSAERNRAEYKQLVSNARELRQKIQPYETKSMALEKLMKDFKLDPSQLSRTSLVAQASAAIQKAAASGGMQVGPVRESPARTSAKELASVQFEASGPVPAVLGLLNRLESLGFPLVVDSVSLSSDPMRPGQTKVSLTIVILDYDQWKNGEGPNA
jgi:hypothetical protein